MPARPRPTLAPEAAAASVVQLPRPADNALVRGELRLGGRLDTRFFALLRAVQASGSLHKAARAAGYSYKGAWLALDAAGNLARTPLVERRIGGRGGGGSALSAAAVELLAVWRELQTRHVGFLREQEAWLANHLQSNPALAGLLRRNAMKTSARNQFVGSVAAIQRGPATSHRYITTRKTLAAAAIQNDPWTAT